MRPLGEERCFLKEPRGLGPRVVVLAAYADPERTHYSAARVANRYCHRADDSRLLRARPDVSRAVGLDVAGRNRLVSLRSQSGHSFADRDSADDLHDLRRDADMRLEDKNSVFDQVDSSGVRPKPTDDI